MKIVIDIPEEEYNLIKIKSESNIGGVSSEAERVIAKGTPIPDNATNGDVIQAVYSHYTFEIESFEGFVRCSYDGWYIRLPICWWDAPYKEGETN